MFDSAGYNAITWSIGNLDNWDVSNITIWLICLIVQVTVLILGQ